MEKLPHTYTVNFEQSDKLIKTDSEKAPTILAGAPPQFGGQDTNWSPETLILASIGQCLFLTFLAVTRASKFDFENYKSQVIGTLEKTDKGTAFTGAKISVSLSSKDEDKAKRLLEKAEKNCLITNSLDFKCTLEFEHT